MLVDFHLTPGPVDLSPSPHFKNSIGTQRSESFTVGRRQSLPTITPDPGRVRREHRPVRHAEPRRRVKHQAGGSGTVPSLELGTALELIPWISPRELEELAIRQRLGGFRVIAIARTAWV